MFEGWEEELRFLRGWEGPPAPEPLRKVSGGNRDVAGSETRVTA